MAASHGVELLKQHSLHVSIVECCMHEIAIYSKWSCVMLCSPSPVRKWQQFPKHWRSEFFHYKAHLLYTYVSVQV